MFHIRSGDNLRWIAIAVTRIDSIMSRAIQKKKVRPISPNTPFSPRLGLEIPAQDRCR